MMENETNLQHIASILTNYDIQPYFAENYGKIYRVYSNKGVFALKKVPPNQGTEFIRHIQFLYHQGYNRIVPIFPTKDGRYAVLHNNELYYLMPWLPNEEKEERKERHLKMFRELARLHTLSVKEITINKEERKEHYEKTIHQWEKESEFVDGFIEVCESNVYMSPFELLFCLYYNDIKQALKFSQNNIKQWYESTKDQEKARRVLSHGKISTKHFLFDEKGYGYFINFEDAKFASPMHDILPFITRTINGFPKKYDECIDWLYSYFKYFPLRDDEMLLFLAYFAHPGPVLRVVEKYYQPKKRLNERKLVQQLQQQFWLLKNTEYVVMRINEIENQKKMQQTEEGAQS